MTLREHRTRYPGGEVTLLTLLEQADREYRDTCHYRKYGYGRLASVCSEAHRATMKRIARGEGRP
jgi:hypothetical protein